MYPDKMHEVKVIYAHNVAALNGNGTSAGAIVDMGPYRTAILALAIAARTDGTYSISGVEVGNDASLSDTAAIDATLRLGDLPSIAAANTIKKCVIKPSHRYFRATITKASTSSGCTGGIVAILMDPVYAPTKSLADADLAQSP